MLAVVFTQITEKLPLLYASFNEHELYKVTSSDKTQYPSNEVKFPIEMLCVTQCTTEYCSGTHSGSGGGVGKQ
jgi:hypothetical protein